MKIIAADETGLIKQVAVESGKVLGAPWGIHSRAHGVQRLCWAGIGDAPEAAVAAVTKQGVVQTWDTKTGVATSSTVLGLRAEDEDDSTAAAVVALQVVRPSYKYFVCSEEGKAKLIPMGDGDEVSFSVGEPVSVARVGDDGAALAVGGRENDLHVWDLETQKTVFKARNVPHDFLDMRVPVWVTDAHFMDSKEGNHTIAVLTGHHHVRVYDTRAQRRPIRTCTLGEYPLKAGALTNDRRSILCGDTMGYMTRVDLGSMKSMGQYKGAGGALRSIVTHPTLPYVASVGLDRFARVHHVHTRKLVKRVYLKQRLTCALFTSEASTLAADKASKGDDVWDVLDKNAGLVPSSGAGGAGAGAGADDGWQVDGKWGSVAEAETRKRKRDNTSVGNAASPTPNIYAQQAARAKALRLAKKAQEAENPEVVKKKQRRRRKKKGYRKPVFIMQ